MLHEFVGSSDIHHLSKANLCDNGTNFATGSRDTVSGGTVPRRESLSRNNESRCVRSKVLEEVGKAVEDDEALGGSRILCEPVVCET